MKPNLIPVRFLAKNIRKKFYRKRNTRSWHEFLSEYSSYLWLVFGLLCILFVLYLKYIEKKEKYANEQYTTSTPHSLYFYGS